MDKFKVTCLNCGESDVLTTDPGRHVVMITDKIMQTPFLSFRWRGDMNWGFLCKCGNDSRLAKQERKDFDKLVAGTPDGVKKIAQSLKIADENKFKMEQA